MNFNQIRAVLSNYGWAIAMASIAGFILINQLKGENGHGSDKQKDPKQNK